MKTHRYTPPPRWRHSLLIAKLGLPEHARKILAQAGYEPPSPVVVAMWRRRAQVSAGWIPAVVLALTKAGELGGFEEALRLPRQ